MTKALYGLGLLLTDSSESLHIWTKRLLLLGSAAFFDACQMHAGICILQLVETRETILTGYKAKLSGDRKGQQRTKKTMTISGRKRIVANKSTHKFFTKVSISKKQIPQLFSPDNVYLGKEKDSNTLTSIRPCRQRFRELNGKKSYLLPGYLSCSSFGEGSVQAL